MTTIDETIGTITTEESTRKTTINEVNGTPLINQ